MAPERRTEHSFFPADRYYFDFGECNPSKGYAQVDTSQDASYYGTWANPFTFTVVQYCEGDVYRIYCKDAEDFKLYLEEVKAWNNKEAHRFIGIDPLFSVKIEEAFRTVGLGEMLH